MDQVMHDRLESGAPPRKVLAEQWLRSRRWLHSHSIRVRLYSVFALLFLLVLGLGAFGFSRLSDVNRVSELIRNHWLRDTRILGDLSNYMSDYRAAEANRLLSSTPPEFAASEKEIASLRDTVAASQRAYEEISQDPSESTLYAQFASQWAAYQSVAGRVIALARAGQTAQAVVLYNTDSRRAFDISSDILSRLTDQTVFKARQDTDRAASTYSHARTMIVTAMLLAAFLLIGVIAYITREILAPLLQLATCMRRLAGQDTEIPIPSVRRDDEIGEMARAVSVFRDNAVALATSQRRLLEQAAALEQGLENERQLTAQQRDFVSMTSHEFRTPLNIIDGHAQRLIKLSDRLDPADAAERGSRIRHAVQRITNIMDSLLGASRVLDGQAVFHPSDFDPSSLLRDACQAHRDATRGAVITEDFSSLPATIHGDQKLLFHAFSNLISNAIKYSSVGSPTELVARQESGWLVVQVRDHGIGIPARDRARLFERYFRGSNATSIAGTGVGLHLVSMVVALHHGEVYVESLEGVGSRFVVRLPVPMSAANAPAVAAVDAA
ncbi:MAG: MCP four helix bundle domain-containing protein [Steroidobacteraceae bacterium]|jgi:signal transduction histidine kinase